MNVVHDWQKSAVTGGSVLALGTFDGVHRGHGKVLTIAGQLAREFGATFGVITFERSPAAILQPQNYAGDVVSLAEKLARLTAFGAQEIRLFTPNKMLLTISAEDFLTRLREIYSLKAIVVGINFRFGKNAAGDSEMLQFWGKRHDIAVRIVPLLRDEAGVLSSSRIRQALVRGEMDAVTAILGRYWSVAGEVVHGDARGRMLGFPTANLVVPESRLLPPNGVYATAVCWRGECYPAVTNIGINPTFNTNVKRIETNLLDFEQDLYGETIYVYALSHLRAERKFSSVADLTAQLRQDAKQAADVYREKFRIDSVQQY